MIFSSICAIRSRSYGLIFFDRFHKFHILIDTEFPRLSDKIRRVHHYRGSRAHWSGFKTWDKNMRIHYKSDKGCVDLQLNNLDKGLHDVKYFIDSTFSQRDFSIVRTGKSISLRLNVPVVDFKQDFLDQREYLSEALTAVMRLEEVADNLPIYELMS